MKKDNLIGTTFGRLTVIDHAESDSRGHSRWVCECVCGNRVVIQGTNLKRGLTTSCGCRRVEVATEHVQTHGMFGTPIYSTWAHMLQRCENPHNKLYHRYGGRGITVCDEWRDFENFHQWAVENGYDPDLTIDRIDNDSGYYPENCRWADRTTQSNNTSQNRRIPYCGMTKTIAEWARLFEMDYGTLYRRIKKNDMRDFERYFKEQDGYSTNQQ